MLLVFGILASVIVLQLACNYVLVEPYYTWKRSHLIERAYEELQKETGNREKMVEIMNDYEDAYNIQFMLANKRMVCIYNSRQQNFRNGRNYYRVKANFSFRKNFSRFSRKPEAVIVSNDGEKNRAKISLFGILESKNQTYYVVIKSNIKSIKENMNETSQLVTVFSGVALALGVILAYIFGKKVSEPIIQMNEVTCHVAKMDFSKTVTETKKQDELASLARNINEMARQIEKNLMQLQEENLYREKIETARKEFISNVSHELKTPLAILSGYAEMLQVAGDTIDKSYYYEVILDEAKKMTDLVNELLRSVRIEEELYHVEMKKLDYSMLVKQQGEKMKKILEQKKLKVTIKVEDGIFVYGNEEYLVMILNNYLSNAMSHTKENGEIRLLLERVSEGKVKLSVYNEGEKIPEEKIEKIWDSFYQVEESHTRTEERKRVGLGLYIVSSIARVHQGTYGVRNCEDGVEFYFYMETV